ncbi:Glycosyltransferase involved in cell wall bisynthesis [Desulfopila aestuarii DSM 18488]|uniref:Glycosyltransferase involved in cell wall bisynthesis n=2 Tax=Desulfopila aestuarii TaxID=231440 RepID=A0A1M7Y965_9BACT|nr:Glycosyltransferase involved in cell wall bisynthesis [Desulfopila aestuarii DSM 18488]
MFCQSGRKMKIAYYMPFKPLGHPNPSGDLILGTEIHDHLNRAGHQCRLVSRLRCRWIYLHPGKLLHLFFERQRILRNQKGDHPNIWLSYHCYYKAPDLLGPWCARRLQIPYVVFQGIYSTKRRRQLLARPGFYLNRQALLSAAMVFTNKRRDEKNLLRLLPPERVQYIPPGIHTANFTFSDTGRQQQRQEWNVRDKVVVMAAAMFRPGVKSEGLKTVMNSCAELIRNGRNIHLVIAGDGRCRDELHAFARKAMGNRVTFCGRIPRNELASVYSGADIFAFPGVEESLGMVYLEAQSCGLPVVAFSDWGGGEAVVNGQTGLTSLASSPHLFTENIDRLILDAELRRTLGQQAATHVRDHHELSRGYAGFTEILEKIASKR